MSHPFGGFSAGGGITIHQDNVENAGNAVFRKTKGTDLQGKPPANKRAALGVITNTTRIQPSRAAKQAGEGGFMTIGNDENIQGKVFKQNESFGFNSQSSQDSFGFKPQSSHPFAIHIDQTENVQPQTQTELHIPAEKPGLQLHQGVTSFRPPLSTVNEVFTIEDSPISHDSPMCLDISRNASHIELGETAEERLEKILTVPEYAGDIYQYLRELEVKHRPKCGYMKKQPDITPSMRTILVDWLVEVAEEYKLHRETLCLAVNYMDRFLSQMSVLRGKLQLVGTACMFLAAKYEEIYPPDVKEFVYITDDTYSQKQVLRMEHLVLKVLSFDVAIPTMAYFCEKFVKDCGGDERTKALAMYLCEMTMIEADPFLKYLPSQIAAAALCLSNHTFNIQPWPSQIAEKTGYSILDFENCLHDLYTTYCKAGEHPQQAIREKYKQSKYHQVSLICPPPTLPGSAHCV